MNIVLQHIAPTFVSCKLQPLINFRDGLTIDPFIPPRRKDKVVIVMGATGTGKSRLSIDLAKHFSAEVVNSDKMQIYEGLDINFRDGLTIDPFIPPRRKDKVVIVMGATGTGKSRLSIDLAKHFSAEVVNSDKMQIYDGLDIITNKVTDKETCGIQHHLLSIIDPNEIFTATDFCQRATKAVDSIISKGQLPIIAGGSNSYIKALVNDDIEFKSRYECCFLWIDVNLKILQRFVSKRVDKMVKEGLVEEAREFFNHDGDYTSGIRRAIGVPEMHQYFISENNKMINEDTRDKMLQIAIENIKVNTYKLACCQRQNIRRLESQFEWKINRLDATEAFEKKGIESNQAWHRIVYEQSTQIVRHFRGEELLNIPSPPPPPSSSSSSTSFLPKVATMTH